MRPNIPKTSVLFEELRPRLKAISLRIVGNEAEAEDVVQDCFFKWHAHEPNVFTTPVAWLTKIVQNRSIDQLRKRARETMQCSAPRS
ncbi:sigma factor [Herminiimonas sp.]|uniref:sigma factor n=1 Tax=Herminiimonas sp. TaxID=1926289 RepID=UPI00351EC64D